MHEKELEAIRKQAEKALKAITPDEFADEAVEIIEHDIPKLIAEIERLKIKAKEIDICDLSARINSILRSPIPKKPSSEEMADSLNRVLKRIKEEE